MLGRHLRRRLCSGCEGVSLPAGLFKLDYFALGPKAWSNGTVIVKSGRKPTFLFVIRAWAQHRTANWPLDWPSLGRKRRWEAVSKSPKSNSAGRAKLGCCVSISISQAE